MILDDPGNLGHMLAQVREAWGDGSLYCRSTSSGSTWFVVGVEPRGAQFETWFAMGIKPLGARLNRQFGEAAPTEVEALIAAKEAADKRGE